MAAVEHFSVGIATYCVQGEYKGVSKQAVEVHKYCVLVTDVPVDALREAAGATANRSHLGSSSFNSAAAVGAPLLTLCEAWNYMVRCLGVSTANARPARSMRFRRSALL